MTVEMATFGGGCFWCLEAAFQKLNGIESVVPGYAGGNTPDPDYEQVCSGSTGHAEVVQIKYATGEVSYRKLLEVFFTIHDPTTLNRQGNDVGTQYRSVVFFHNDKQKSEAEDFISKLNTSKIWRDQVVTEVVPLEKFYEGEIYHHNYYLQNPSQSYCQLIISPKLEKLF
ncbi:MAG: peptide-methionine (S)-S-oxide reductase MsrA, partial [Gammaproteobacteria bacterium]|nr:peptide-methionine (S)-S-oxide reductase MsrA [Gammaproteobacteria bacterium]